MAETFGFQSSSREARKLVDPGPSIDQLFEDIKGLRDQKLKQEKHEHDIKKDKNNLIADFAKAGFEVEVDDNFNITKRQPIHDPEGEFKGVLAEFIRSKLPQQGAPATPITPPATTDGDVRGQINQELQQNQQVDTPNQQTGTTDRVVGKTTVARPQQSKSDAEFDVTGISISEDGSVRVTIGETDQSKSRRKSKIKMDEKFMEEKQLKEESFNKFRDLFSGVVAQWKAKKKQQGGKTGFVPTQIAKFKAGIKGLGVLPKDMADKVLGETGAVGAFPGQIKESVLALNSIITGQNRVIKGVVEMIMETMPGENLLDEQMIDRVTQTITNAYRLKRAFDKSQLTFEEMEAMNRGQLTDLREGYTMDAEEQEAVGVFVQEILNTPAAKKFKFDQPVKGKKQQNTGSGTTKSGVKFKRVS